MKKIIITLLFLFFSLGVLSGASKESSALVIKGEGASEIIHIVYPDDCNDLIKQFAVVFAEKLSESIDLKVSAHGSESFFSSAVIPRIYIGEKFEEDVDSYLRELEAANDGLLPFVIEDEFSWEKYCGYRTAYSMECYYKPHGMELHIKASDEYVLYCAIEDFLNEVKNCETYTFENGYKYVTPDNHVFKDPSNAIGTGNAYFHATDPVAIFPKEYIAYTDALQGGGTDGKYAYYCGLGSLNSIILQYNINTWELDYISDPVYSRHSNSVTYLPETNELMISHCEDEENDSRGVSYVDAETLKETLNTILPVRASRLEYHADREKYYILKSETVYVLDKDLNVLSEQPSGDSRGTPQGCCCDDRYLFDIRWDVEDGSRLYDHALIYELDTMEYKFAAELKGYDEDLEPENIFKDDTVFYIGFHHIKYGNFELGTVYRFVLLPEIWWE